MISLLCPAIIIVNLTTESWKSIDQKNLDVAKYRCSQIFPDAPCVKKFIKKEPLVYNVICSETNRKRYPR